MLKMEAVRIQKNVSYQINAGIFLYHGASLLREFYI